MFRFKLISILIVLIFYRLRPFCLPQTLEPQD